jgi:hypothetical protein
MAEPRQRALDPRAFGGQKFPCPLRIHGATLSDWRTSERQKMGPPGFEPGAGTSEESHGRISQAGPVADLGNYTFTMAASPAPGASVLGSADARRPARTACVSVLRSRRGRSRARPALGRDGCAGVARGAHGALPFIATPGGSQIFGRRRARRGAPRNAARPSPGRAATAPPAGTSTRRSRRSDVHGEPRVL